MTKVKDDTRSHEKLTMKLYRFEKVDDLRLKTLEDRNLWCSSPIKFNDLSDCRMNMLIDKNISPIPDNVLNAIDENVFNSPLGKVVVSRLLTIIRKKHLADIFNTFSIGREIEFIREHIIKTTCACCFFASNALNSLMWAHYADNHKGFCIEYDVNKSNENYKESMFEINYMSKLPEVSPEELLFNPNSAIKRVVSSKSNIWSYEKEYRIILINGLSGSNIGNGRIIPLPEWLTPAKVICGAKQTEIKECELYYDVNTKMETLAVRLGIPRYRIKSDNGELQLQELS